MIIGLSGYKQAGKNTCCNFLGAYRLMNKHCIESFELTPEGQILSFNEHGQELGIYRIEDEHEFNAAIAWQFVRVFSYADTLKKMVVDYFGISPEQVYGNDEDKNSPTLISWSDLPRGYKKYNTNKNEFMTGREFLQVFGTNIMRHIYDDIWCMACMKNIKQHVESLPIPGSCLCLVSDVRFPNEVNAIRNTGGKIIRLTREPCPDDSDSEHALDPEVFDWDNFDAVIDNSNMTIPEQNHALFNQMCEWGLFDAEEITDDVTLLEQATT